MEIDNLTLEVEELRSTIAKDEALGQQLANEDQIKTESHNSRSEMQAVIDDLTIEVQELKTSVTSKEDELHQHLAILDQIKLLDSQGTRCRWRSITLHLKSRSQIDYCG
ncbi:hypothetical protein MHU86_18225 [Fragilaria crotonensis]|nr:hypothetical protein MHU86_18225 [Fragilaria crotonensis]